MYKNSHLGVVQASCALSCEASGSGMDISIDPWYFEMAIASSLGSDPPRPPNVPLSRALRFLLDGIRGVLQGSWGMLVM